MFVLLEVKVIFIAAFTESYLFFGTDGYNSIINSLSFIFKFKVVAVILSVSNLVVFGKPHLSFSQKQLFQSFIHLYFFLHNK